MRKITRKTTLITLSIITLLLSCNTQVKTYKGCYSITNTQEILYETEDYLFLTHPSQDDNRPVIEVWFNNQTTKEGRVKHDLFRCITELKVYESKNNYIIFTVFKTHEQVVQIFKNCEHIQ